MDTAELDAAIDELELRLERLRSLYEQYFLGIEKIEPAVARKDVDRRIWHLKREKIRNTARRFKLQTVIQRYNTYQQYWQRICREIENGTYRRHVLRAERATATVSDVVAKQERERATEEKKVGADQAVRAASDQLSEMLARDVDAEQEFARAVAAAARASKPRSSQAPRQRMDTLDLELEALEPATAGERESAGSAGRPRNLLAALGPRAAATSRTGVNAPAGPPVRPPRRPLATAKPESPAQQPAQPAAAPRAPAAAKSASAQAVGLSDQRIAELHQQLLAAKQRTKEIGKVSVQGLAKSLRAAEAKLKQQHKNRRIDFDVIVKNGKAVIKPKVR